MLNNLNDVQRYLNKITASTQETAVDLETVGLDPYGKNNYVIIMGMYNPDAGGVAIPILSTIPGEPNFKTFWNDKWNELHKMIGEYLSDSTCKKIGHNFKYDIRWLRRYGWVTRGVVGDTMLLARLVDENIASKKDGGVGSSLKELSQFYLGVEEWEKEIEFFRKDFCKRHKILLREFTWDKVPLHILEKYNILDAQYTHRLYSLFLTKIRPAHLEIHNKLTLPTSLVLGYCEDAGMRVSVDKIKLCTVTLEDKIKANTQALEELGCVGINFNSPKQLAKLLYEDLKLPKYFNHKTKKITTDALALRSLSKLHPIPALLSENRKDVKLLTGYMNTMLSRVGTDGRIHPNFNVDKAVTGRTSSSNPNFQNLNKFAKQIFIPEDGYTFVQMDYGQLELRILAVLANDTDMIEAFYAGKDIHSETTALIFNISPEEVTEELRKIGKTMGFAIIYGMGIDALATTLDIDEDKADSVYRAYTEAKPGITDYVENQKMLAQRLGYVISPFGRMRKLPAACKNDHHALRQAVNAPIQGAGSDMTLSAMLRMTSAINKSGLKAYLVCTVHDSLVYECAKSDVAQFIIILKQVCEQTAHMPWWNPKVPLVADINIGLNLAELGEVESLLEEEENEESEEYHAQE